MATALSVLPLLASTAFAQDDDMTPEGRVIVSCYDAKDWDCAFDKGVVMMKAEGFVADCLADTHHGCMWPMYFLYSAGVGATVAADSVRRREIADRALELVRPMSEGAVDTYGEIMFSALRYDACKSMGDETCMEESAALLRLARKSPDYDEEDPGYFGEVMEEVGVRYPLNLHAIMAEVAQTEKLQ